MSGKLYIHYTVGSEISYRLNITSFLVRAFGVECKNYEQCMDFPKVLQFSSKIYSKVKHLIKQEMSPGLPCL